MIYCRLARAEDSTKAAAVEAGKGEPIYFTAATAGVKSDGYDLGALPWDFSRALGGGEGPRFPLMFAHDLSRASLGVVEVLTPPDEQPTRIAAYFDPDDPEAVAIERKYRSPLGGMNAVSVQWMTVDKAGKPARAERDAAANQLMEISACAVGLDGDALQDGARALALARHAAALRSMAREIDAALDDDDADDLDVTVETTITIDTVVSAEAIDVNVSAADDKANESADAGEGDPEADAGRAAPSAGLDDGDAYPETVERAWAAMVRALDRASDADDAERRRQYNRAESAYRRLGMVAPEWIGGDELRAMDDETWRGIWLEGEIATARAGAVLSRRNIARLDAAIDALMEIRREAAGEDGEPSMPMPKADDADRAADTAADLARIRQLLFGGHDG